MSKSEAENRFAAAWAQQVPDSVAPAPLREFRFHPEREWRFDFAWPDAKLALELEGVGVSKGMGRHQRLPGMREDCEKYNEAVRLGWRMLRFMSADKADVLQWVEYVVEVMHYV